MTVSIRSSSSGVGSRVTGGVVGNDELEPGGVLHLVRGHARVHRPETHAVVVRLEVEHGQVGDDEADLVEPGRLLAERRGAVVPDPADRVDALAQHRRAVVRHPVGGRVVDRVAGRAPVAQQLHLRLPVVADGGEVLVAVLVDLGAAHHDVATAVPHPAEHLPIRVEVLDDLAFGPLERLVVGDEPSLPVRHGEVGLEGGAGQASPDHRDGPDRVGQDLAVAAEALGHGDDAHVRPLHETSQLIGHRAPPSRRSRAW